MAEAIKLSNVNATLLPPTIAAPIFDQSVEDSAVMSLATRVPLAQDAPTAIPISMDVPVAGWVAEGGKKPVGAGSIGVKQMSGKKLALLLPFSQEVVRSNPAGLFTQMQSQLPTALARAFDYAAIQGLDLRTGGAGPFPEFLKQTTNSQELGATSQANGGMYADLVKGEKQVVDANYDYSGTAIDPRIKPLLKLQVDTTGRPIWVDTPQQGLIAGSLIGYPAFSSRGVSGHYRRAGNKVQVVTITGTPTGGTFTLSSGGNTTSQAFNAAAATLQTAIRAWGGIYAGVTVAGSAGGPYTITFPLNGAVFTASGAGLTGGTAPAAVVAQTVPEAPGSLRGIGGDWSQAAFGVGMDITMKSTDIGSYEDEAGVMHSAFQENLVVLLIEAYYGFVVGNVNAFVAYTDAA